MESTNATAPSAEEYSQYNCMVLYCAVDSTQLYTASKDTQLYTAVHSNELQCTRTRASCSVNIVHIAMHISEYIADGSAALNGALTEKAHAAITNFY